jgi:hypothetical protein
MIAPMQSAPERPKIAPGERLLLKAISFVFSAKR